jgi:prepilin-type N-terminal cleavage/methylation domain-containing protein
MTTKARSIRKKGRQSGYTLIELMIGVVIVAMSALALYQMIVAGKTLITQDYHRRLGVEKAYGHMEELRYYKTQYGEIPKEKAGRYFENLIDDIEAEYILRIEDGEEKRANGKPHYYNVSIEYTWMENSGKAQMVDFSVKF